MRGSVSADVRRAGSGRPHGRLRSRLRLLRRCRERRVQRGGPGLARGDHIRREREPPVHRRAAARPRRPVVDLDLVFDELLARKRPFCRAGLAHGPDFRAVACRRAAVSYVCSPACVSRTRSSALSAQAAPSRCCTGRLTGFAVSRSSTGVPGVGAVPLGAPRGRHPRARAALVLRRLPAASLPQAHGARHPARRAESWRCSALGQSATTAMPTSSRSWRRTRRAEHPSPRWRSPRASAGPSTLETDVRQIRQAIRLARAIASLVFQDAPELPAAALDVSSSRWGDAR